MLISQSQCLTRAARLVICAAVFPALLGVSADTVEAKPFRRFGLPFSPSATFRGHTGGAFYVIDSGRVRQYNEAGSMRGDWSPGERQEFICSPKGLFHVVADSAGDSEGGREYTFYNVLRRPLHRSALPQGGQLYLGDLGRYVTVEPGAGSGVDIFMYDSLGQRTGSAHAPSCDSVVFAPGGRGLLIHSPGKGLYHFYFSGGKVATYPPAELFAFSLSGRRVATFQMGILTLHFADTTVGSFRVSAGSARRIIYDDSRGVVNVLTATRLLRVRATDGRELLNYPVIGEGRRFTDMEYSPESDLFALSILVSLGSTAPQEQRALQNAVRVITPEGDGEPFYYVSVKSYREGFPRIQMGSNGLSALFICADRVERISW
ncbi:MAG: hypothetical protein ACE5GA_07435 [Candidatus Zixiibacteriota bacterium]